MTEDVSRFCREVQEQLPALLAGELSGWSQRTMRAHLRRCAVCRSEQARQQELGAALGELRGTAPEPPAELLDGLLARARATGLRERAAVPARGAVSGARPGLSLAFLTVGAVASTGVGWAAWRGARAVGRRLSR
jgi:predicted anti-sigma-YlaC factor YlaD